VRIPRRERTLKSTPAGQVGPAGTFRVTSEREDPQTACPASWTKLPIARDTGHANPNWFCHVFRVHTGLTPNGYRRQSRQPPRPARGP
jgi:hypothetical protein